MHNNLTNKELVQTLFNNRQHSPIIEELCSRLEKNDIEINFDNECPVCLSKLNIEYSVTDGSDEVVNIKPRNKL